MVWSLSRYGGVTGGQIEAGDGAGFGIGERGSDVPEKIGWNAHVAVADDDHFVLRLADHAGELGDFVIGGVAAGAEEDADASLGKIADEPLDDRERRIVVFIDAEEDFEVGIVLAAEAGEVFVRVGIETADGFQIADRRREIGRRRGRVAEETPGAIKGEKVVDKWERGYAEDDSNDDGMQLTSLLPLRHWVVGEQDLAAAR